MLETHISPTCRVLCWRDTNGEYGWLVVDGRDVWQGQLAADGPSVPSRSAIRAMFAALEEMRHE
jgi:hypothetical protein